MRRLVVVPFVVVLVLVGCGGKSGSPTQPANFSPFQVEAQSVDLINNERAQSKSLSELTMDQLLAQVAREHSEAMRDQGFFAHVNPNGQTLRNRLRKAGVSFRAAGENLAQVQGSSDPAGHAHRMLMDSQSHRDNILGPHYDSVGVGVAQQGDTYWITQVFLQN